MPAPDYHILAGTVIGEVRNEVFNKHGLSAYETAKYGWHHSFPTESINKTKMYNLVSGSSSVEFLLTAITYALKPFYVDNSLITSSSFSGSFISSSMSAESSSASSLKETFIKDTDNPIEIEFLWYDANIPFLEKDTVDAQGISYILR